MPQENISAHNLERGQIVRYVINGLAATAIHFSVLYININALGFISAGLANLVAALFGITASFLGSRYFVFTQHTESITRQAAKFGSLYALIAILHGVVLYIWSDSLSLDYKLGFLLATAMQMVLSYFGNKKLVFNK